MLTQRLANIVFAILVIIACICFGVIAQGFKTGGLLASSGLPSRFFPQLTLGFTALCAGIVVFLYARNGGAGGDEGQTVFASAGDARRGLLMLAVAVLCYLLWIYAGFIVMAVAIGPLSLLAMGVRAAPIYLAVAALTALVYAIFRLLLGVQLI